MEQVDGTGEGTWYLFPWFPEHGDEMVYSEDLAALAALSPYGKVFRSAGIEGKYCVLTYGAARFRVTPELLRPVNPPVGQIGDTVMISLEDASATATVVEIHWHHKRGEPYYLVERDGKASTKRYWGSDLSPIP